MRSGTALVIAICFIFGAAMVAEFSGIIPRDVQSTPVETADAAAPADEGADTEAFDADSPEWGDLRIGVIGGFLVACIFVLMRSTGEFL